MNNKGISDKCKTETIRRKLYRRINWINQNPRKEKFMGFNTEELFPVFSLGKRLDGHNYMLFRFIHGKTYQVEVLEELPDLFLKASEISNMGFKVKTIGYSASIIID